MKTAKCLLAVQSLLLLSCGGFLRAAESSWHVEAEAAEVSHDKAVKLVNDSDASGGKALEVPPEGVPNWNVVCMGLPAATTPGRYEIKARIKASEIPDIGKAWRFEIRDDAKLLGFRAAYGCYLKGQKGYQDFVVPFTWANPTKRPGLYMRWNHQAGGTGTQTNSANPVLRLDSFEIVRTGDLPELRISQVWPDRVRYLEKQDGDITVTVENLSAQAAAAKVRLELIHDLDAPLLVGEQDVTIDAGKSSEVKFPFKNPGLRFGYSAKAALTMGGKEIDSQEEFFTVYDNPWAVATGGPDQESGDYQGAWWGTFYGIGATDKDIEDSAMMARKQYFTCTEFFSWSPGECFDMAPEKEFWIRGNGGDLLRSKREIQRSVAALHKQGIACITYIAYQAMGEKTLEIIREKPEWFTYSGMTGDISGFYVLNELEKRKEFWKVFDWEKYKTDANPNTPGWQDTPESWKKYQEFWRKPAEECRKLSIIGYFDPNYKLPEVVDYCADQVIASSKMFGWDGLRWDCGHLNPGPIWGTFSPVMDFYGKPQAKTIEEMEQATVENLKRLKARIRAQLPSFAIGTNFGSWEETHRYPKQVEELTREGGWLLDEFSYGYNSPQSPYHFWDAYYAIMADEGEHVTSLGGHYNPFAFNRNGGKYPVDGLYETVFRIAGKGHPNSVYFNSQTPFGNFPQFCVRFGRFVFDPSIRRLEKPEEIVTVQAAAPLWWNKTVGRLKEGGAEYLIVHLINPPVQKEVETDPMSTLPQPIDNVNVTVNLPSGKKNAAVWALSAESWKTGEAPRTQAVPLKVQMDNGKAGVAVPQILCWKMLVFKFE